MVELSITDKTIAQSLLDFVGREADSAEGLAEITDLEAARRQLDRAATCLALASFSLRYTSEGAELRCTTSLDEFLEEHHLSAQLFSPTCDPQKWAAGSTSVKLYEGPVKQRDQTGFVIFEASRKDNPEINRRWTQTVEIDAFNRDARDDAAIAAYIGARRFRDWFKMALEGMVPLEGETWDGRRSPQPSSDPAARASSLFTLEYVLARWAKNPTAFEGKVDEITRTLEAMRLEITESTDPEDAAEAQADLEAILPFWEAVQNSIEVGSRL
jgi:hypothetical protein